MSSQQQQHRSSTGSGLGISFPALSPPTVSTTQVSTGFTATSPSRPSHNAASPDSAASPSRQAGSTSPNRTSPTRPAHSKAGQQLFQPAFSLRPTHHRSTSVKNFASFSALPPSPGALTPARARLEGHGSRGGTFNSRTNSTMSDRGNVDGFGEWQNGSQAPEGSAGVARSTSNASTATNGSRIRKSRSSDLIRKLSKTHETVAGARYVPLSGEDEQPARQPTPGGSRGHQDNPHNPYDQKRQRSDTVSTASANPAQSPQDFDPTPTDSYSSFLQSAFPAPPHRPTSMDPQHATSSATCLSYDHPAMQMPRSASQPNQMYASENHYYPSSPGDVRDGIKRISDPVTGVHSQNYALIAAEKGGKFLAYTADGGWSANSLIATPRPATPSGVMPHSVPVDIDGRSAKSGSEEDHLRRRPWSDSTMSNHRPLHVRSLSEGATLARQGTLLHPQSAPQRASDELGIMLGNKNRKLGKDKILPPPDLTAWQQNGGAGVNKVKLEAARKRKARVEVDIVLERECVVEGGEVRGRLEVRVNGAKRDGLRIGGGKVRVVGYEDISSSSRHIFYHHPCPLPAFAHPPLPNGPKTSLFASSPDSEGYREATFGIHWMPFCMRLPISGGAKGAYTTPGGKGPAVRYVVVGSVKLLMPRTGKRSIAHFYRPIVILPYLNPGLVLAPDEESVEVIERRGLGWTLGGGKGVVELRIALGRSIWVAGQRVWCEVGVKNESTKRIKTLTLALLQTVQTFLPDNHTAAVSTDKDGIPNADEALGIASTVRRKMCEEVMEADDISHGAGRVTGKRWWTGVDAGEMGGWDLSLLIPNGLITIPRSQLIEVTYTLRLTANSSLYVDIPVTLINFLSIDPPPMPGDGARLGTAKRQSITAMEDQKYANPVASTSGGVYGASMRSGESVNGVARASSTTLHIDALLSAGRARAEMEAALHYQDVVEPRGANRPLSMGSLYTPEGAGARSHFGTPAPASAITGGITGATPIRPKGVRLMSYLSVQSSDHENPLSEEDEDDDVEDEEQDRALLAAARREGRKMSLAALTRAADREKDDYMRDVSSPMGETPPPGAWMPAETPYEEVFKVLGETPSMASAIGAGSSPMPIPGSARTGITEKLSSGDHHNQHTPGELGERQHHRDGPDPNFDEATIERLQNMTIAEEQQGLASTRESWDSHENPEDGDQGGTGNGSSGGYADRDMRPMEGVSMPNPFGDYGTLELGKRSHESIPEEEEEDLDANDLQDIGNETVLEDLVAPRNDEDTLRMVLPPSAGDEHPFEYGEEVHESEPGPVNQDSLGSGTGNTASSLRVPSRSGSALEPHVLLSVNSEREAHIQQSRSVYGSFAASAVSEQESEVGQVVEAVKRNLSVKTPSRTMKLEGHDGHDGADEADDDEGDVFDDRLSPTRALGPHAHRSGSAPFLGAGGRKNSHTTSPEKRNDGLSPTKGGAGRYGSAPNVHGLPMRRESSTPSAPSPLREEAKPLATAPVSRSFPARPSFSFSATAQSKNRETSLSPRGGSAFSFAPLSPGPSPRSKFPTTLTTGEPMGRGLSAQSSQLRNQVRPSSISSGEEGLPPLAPSVASDSASSEGHERLESPPVVSMPTAQEALMSHSPKGSILPANLPSGKHHHKASTGEFAPVLDPNWIPGEHLLHTQVAYARTSFSAPDAHDRAQGSSHSYGTFGGNNDSPTKSMRSRKTSAAATARSVYSQDASTYHTDNYGQNHSPNLSSDSGHSVMLSGVQNRLKQLDARNEALRKFSVASIASAGGGDAAGERKASLPQVQGNRRLQREPEPSQHGTEEGEKEKKVRKRRSYTAALAPRPTRSTSDDVIDRSPDPVHPAYPVRPAHHHTKSQSSLGGTTYIMRRTFGGSPPPLDPSPGGYVPVGPPPLPWQTQSPPRIELNFSPPSRPGAGLQRHLSNSSASTTATSIEAALLRRPIGPRSPPATAQAPAIGITNPTPAIRQGDINPYAHNPTSSTSRGGAGPRPRSHHYETPGYEVYGTGTTNSAGSNVPSHSLGSIGRSRSGFLTAGEMEYGEDVYGSEQGSVASRNGRRDERHEEWQAPRMNWAGRGSMGTESSEGLL